MLGAKLFHDSLKINSAKFSCILLLEGCIEGRGQLHSEVLWSEWPLLLK
jgi:hypothetical protein